MDANTKPKSLTREMLRPAPGAPAIDQLGPLKNLPGKWETTNGRGWNMIALPFAGAPIHYRLLVNQYNEKLHFSTVDKGVPNRGVTPDRNAEADQEVATLDYEQQIVQIAVEDNPRTDEATTGKPGAAIHHEPGLWLHMRDQRTDGLDIARLGTIPHGNSVLALGRSEVIEGKPEIPDFNGLPINVTQDLDSRYLAPYKHYNDNPFLGLFNPVKPNELLKDSLAGFNVARTTILDVDTRIQDAGIVNIPFIEAQADAAEMRSIFWILELEDQNERGEPNMALLYTQEVLLDFFEGQGGNLIRWPHVSINTLLKVDKFSDEE